MIVRGCGWACRIRAPPRGCGSVVRAYRAAPSPDTPSGNVNHPAPGEVSGHTVPAGSV